MEVAGTRLKLVNSSLLAWLVLFSLSLFHIYHPSLYIPVFLNFYFCNFDILACAVLECYT